MSCIDFPKVPCLAIEIDDLLHSFKLGVLPFLIAHSLWLRQDEHTRLDLELMRMPQLLLIWRKRLVYCSWHHVLYTNEFCVFLVRIVDEALTKIFASMRAIVGGLDVSCFTIAGIISVDVDCCQEFAYGMKRLEFLS